MVDEHWRDVRDEEPEPGIDVLVAVNACPGKIRTAYRTATGDWYDFGVRVDGNPVEVTHWMPLPAPPNA